MADTNMPTPPSVGNITVTAVEGEPRIRDLDLAERLGFAKPAKIRELIARHSTALSALGELPTVGTTHEANGRTFSAYYLNRKQAIFITAKSETPQATDITIEIIEKFDAYERGAMAPAIDPMKVLNDPAAMRGLLLTYTERVLALEAIVQEQAPTVAAYDRIAKSDGSMCLTDAAKDLQIRPKDLFAFCRAHKWVYDRPGKSGVIAYQDKIQAGYLEHKVKTVSRSDGSEKTVEQVRVTPKGLARLAMIVPGAKGANGHHIIEGA